MYFIKLSFKYVAIAIVSSLLFACSNESNMTQATLTIADTTQQPPTQKLLLDVYKSPTCGCCNKWISHLHDNEIESTPHHPSDITAIKSQFGIQTNYQSCHTAVSQGGYVFEGHIPAKFIKKFLADTPPDSIGLSVPRMPLGSPGMEVGDQFREYSVLLLHKNGSSSVYADIKNASQQY